jgi:NifU-like protein involved in Fe-S cluster formation
MGMTVFNLLMTVLAITGVALLWFVLHYYLNSLMENPDGIAKVTGSCGDTMEIALKFNGPKVEDVHCWTDGCAISKMCVETVGMLARGKTFPELNTIDTTAILERVGKLPDTHMHCAVLAETTLKKALSDYRQKNPGGTSVEERAVGPALQRVIGASRKAFPGRWSGLCGLPFSFCQLRHEGGKNPQGTRDKLQDHSRSPPSQFRLRRLPADQPGSAGAGR